MEYKSHPCFLYGLGIYSVHGFLGKEDEKERKMGVLVILSWQSMTFSHCLGKPHPKGLSQVRTLMSSMVQNGTLFNSISA